MINPRILVEQIALFLGPPWKFKTLKPSDWRFEIIDGSGQGMFFRVDGQRFKISGLFPRNKTSVYCRDYKTISVSLHRPAKDIANDISRRLIPHYLKAYEKSVQRYQEEQEQDNKRLLILRAIAKVTGGQMDTYRQGNTIYFDCGKAEISCNEKVDLHLRHLPVELAVKIAAMVTRES